MLSSSSPRISLCIVFSAHRLQGFSPGFGGLEWVPLVMGQGKAVHLLHREQLCVPDQLRTLVPSCPPSHLLLLMPPTLVSCDPQCLLLLRRFYPSILLTPCTQAVEGGVSLASQWRLGHKLRSRHYSLLPTWASSGSEARKRSHVRPLNSFLKSRPTQMTGALTGPTPASAAFFGVQTSTFQFCTTSSAARLDSLSPSRRHSDTFFLGSWVSSQHLSFRFSLIDQLFLSFADKRLFLRRVLASTPRLRLLLPRNGCIHF